MIELIKENEEQKESSFDYLQYIVKADKINKDIDDFFKGKIKQGYKLGIAPMDRHMVHKDNTFYASTGRKGRGKTTITNLFHVCVAIAHGLKFAVCYKENKDWSMKLSIMNYILGDFAKDVEKTNNPLYQKASDWVDEHFYFLDVDDIKTACDVTASMIDNGIDIHALVLDPANSLDSGWNNSGNEFKDGKSDAKKILAFREKYCSVHMSQHPTTGAQRTEGDITSNQAEGGWYFNKADYTYSLNRDNGDNVTRCNVENIRNKLTGGDTTFPNKEMIVIWTPTRVDIGYNGGGEIHEDVVGYLMRKHNPLSVNQEYIEDMPKITLDEAFDNDTNSIF